MGRLVVCQKLDAKRPYEFKLTGVKITSIEELYYYCYHHYTMLLDEFPEADLLNWIKEELKLPSVVTAVTTMLNNSKSKDEVYLSFLQFFDYFNEAEINELKKKIKAWEEISPGIKFKQKGDRAFRSQSYQEALRYYLEAITFDQSKEIYHNLGVVYMCLNQGEKAIEFFEKAISIELTLETLRQYLYALLILKKYSILDEHLKDYVLQYDDAHLWFIYGKYYEEIEDIEKALTAYYRAIDLDDSFVDVYEAMTKLYVNTKQFTIADELLQRIKEKNPISYALNFALLSEANGQVDVAIEYLEEHMESNCVELYIKLSYLYEKQNQMIKALDAIHKGQQLDPTNTYIDFRLSLLNKQVGHVNHYYQTVDKLIEEWKENYRLQSS